MAPESIRTYQDMANGLDINGLQRLEGRRRRLRS